MPSVRPVRLRPRSDSSSSDAADRVLGLLGVPAVGWVPPATHAAQEEELVEEVGPPAVRYGRVDPGRRGAAALVVAALLAAVVAGAVLLRGRPQEVVVP